MHSRYHLLMPRLERFAVHVVVFLAGALLMSLEVAAFRMIGKTFGSALRETTAVIAVFLAAMSIGYWGGGRIGDRHPRPQTLVAVLLSTAALLLVVPWLDAIVSPWIAASRLELATHAFVATSVLFALPTVLFASVSPIAVRLFTTSTGTSGSTAGSISALSTVGSITGSVVTAFLLIDWLGSIARTVLTVALATCVTVLVLVLSTLPRVRRQGDFAARLRPYAFAAIGVFVVAVPAIAFIRSTRIEHSLVARDPSIRTLFIGDSPYHRVTVQQRGDARTLHFSMAMQSRMLVHDPFGPGASYTDAIHLARFMRPDVRRILIIGLGGGTAAKQFVHYYPDTIVDVVEIDPVVVQTARRYFGVVPSDRLRIHVGDGRMFLKHATGTWDLIVIDAYTTNGYGDTIPPHLVTREFFREVKQRLAPGGVLHFHCAFGGTKLLLALQKTIGSVFHERYTSEGEILASDVALLTPTETVLERARTTRAGSLPGFERYARTLRPYSHVAEEIPLLTDDYAPVDTLR